VTPEMKKTMMRSRRNGYAGQNADFSSHLSAGNELAILHISGIDGFSGDRDGSRHNGEREHDHEPVMSLNLGPCCLHTC